MEKAKECFWRHGDFKTIRIIEHVYNGKGKEGYTVKRIFTIQQCGYCGKLIIQNS